MMKNLNLYLKKLRDKYKKKQHVDDLINKKVLITLKQN